MKKICLNCQKEFETQDKDKHFCSALCKAETWKASKSGFGNHKTNPESIKDIPIFSSKQHSLVDTLNKIKRSEDFLVFCHSMLWPTRDFSEGQKHSYTLLIAEHFKDSANIDETFKALVERVVLAKRYVLEKPYRFISEPTHWLNIRFSSGISGSEKWHNALQEQRKISPEFGKSLLLFSEAILKYASGRNILDIAVYRRKLVNLKEWDLLQWYMNAIIHYQFINH